MKAAFSALVALAAVTVTSGQSIITTRVGTDWIFPFPSVRAVDAPIGRPYGIVIDSAQNLYVSDYDSHMIMRVGTDGMLTVFAGNGFQINSGDGGPATRSGIFHPQGLALDRSGSLYVAESYEHRLRKIANGVITTAAGQRQGFAGDGSNVASSLLNYPTAVAIDSAGNIYFSDTQNGRVRRITSSGVIDTIAGNGSDGFSGDGGRATLAMLNRPEGVAVDAAGNVYVADTFNERIRRIGTDGIITTIAGSVPGYSGDNEPAAGARLNRPKQLHIAPDGTLYIADAGNNVIRRIGRDGRIVTVAGNGRQGYSGDGGPATSAALGSPTGMAVDSSGNLYIADTRNQRVRRVTLAGTISTVVGNGRSRLVANGTPATAAFVLRPEDIATDRQGNLYIADTELNRVAKVTPDGLMETIAGTGQYGFSGDGGPATQANMIGPRAVTVDSQGNVYIVDSENFRIRRINTANVIETIAGTGQPGYSGDGGPALRAAVGAVRGLTVDADDNLYLSDQAYHVIRRIDRAGNISTIAGTGTAGYTGDGGPARSATLRIPEKLAFDWAGNLYFADVLNHVVRRITPAGRIDTVAGSGRIGVGGDGGPATQADIASPTGVACDSEGNVYISAVYFGVVHKLTPDGNITAIAGNRRTGLSGDGGPATSASMWIPEAVAVGPGGVLYIADTYNDRIRQISNVAPTLETDVSDIVLEGRTAGATTERREINVRSSLPTLRYSVQTDGGEWLKADVESGVVPSQVRIHADPGNLEAGTYNGRVTILAPGANPPAKVVPVTLQINESNPAKLEVSDGPITFQLIKGRSATRSVSVANGGSGSLPFTVETSTTSGAAWLSVSSTEGTALATSPVALAVTASTDSLAAGTYFGTITVRGPNEQVGTIPVIVAVTDPKPLIVLSGNGLRFQTITGGARPAAQTIQVLNAGDGQMDWSVATRTLSGGSSWLEASRDSSSNLRVSVNPAGLQPGDYYGQVLVWASGADNSPQSVTIVMAVLLEGENPGPELSAGGLVFTGAIGSNPNSQNVDVSYAGKHAIAFSSGRVTQANVPWFVYGPSNGSVRPGESVSIAVQPDFSKLTAGVHRGSIALQFDDGSIRNIGVLAIVADAQSSAQAAKSGHNFAEGCTPARILIQPTSTNVTGSYGQASVLSARITDDCRAPVTDRTPGAAVTVGFSNGDQSATMKHIGDGAWSTTWVPRNTRTANMQATVTAFTVTGGGRVRAGQTDIPIVITVPRSSPPIIDSGAIGNAASLVRRVPGAPGLMSLVTGEKLADETASSDATPLPRTLGGTTAVLADQQLPLFRTADGQIVVQLPFESPANTEFQLTVQRGDTLSMPEPVTIAPAQPAIFTKSADGTGQGMITSAGSIADEANPVGGGTEVLIEAAGLGPVTPAGQTGVAAAAGTRTVNTVEVLIGEQRAEVVSAGLKEGAVGVYEVRVKVPEGVTPGNAVPVKLMVSGQQSPIVTMAIK